MPKRPVALEDLLRFQIPGDTQISPDGGAVAFTVRRLDGEKNKQYVRLWMLDAESGVARPFTGDGHSDTEPRWDPSGERLAFVSDRDMPGSQLYLISRHGGEAERLTRLEEGVVQWPAWSPDGSRIAFLYRPTPEAWRDQSKKARQEKDLSSPVRVHRKLFYRLDGFGYFDDSFPQLWVADAATGEARAVAAVPHSIRCPSWTPDGRSLVFLANLNPDDDLEPLRDDIWIVAAEGGEIRRIPSPAGPKEAVAVSPDGRWIAFIGHTDLDDTWGGRNDRVLVMPFTGAEEARDLTGSSDLAVGYLTLSDMHDAGGGQPLQWTPDSGSLLFPVSSRGDTRLFRVDLEGGPLTPLTPPDHEMGAFSLSADGRRIAALVGSATDLHQATVFHIEEHSVLQGVSAGVNGEILAQVELQMPEEFEIQSGDGTRVHGWLLRPIPFHAGRRHPCVLYVHGGPALQYGGRSAPFHELQLLAASGFAVVFCNPRGSKGYGEAHTMAIKGDWGSQDWTDVQAVADYAADLPFVDPSRMAIMGGSYGGYMTAWAIGHTDRFRCAIADRLVSNLHSMSGTCDFPWQHGKFYRGNAWDDPSDLWRVSPLHFAGRINTPLLLVHSDGDLRCPVGQAEELFAALRLQRKEVEFVRYPAESSHGLSRNGPPDLRLDRLRRNLEWLRRHLNGIDPEKERE